MRYLTQDMDSCKFGVLFALMTGLRVGEVSTIVPHYLEDCWNWAVDRTELLKGCRLDIDVTPAVTWCDSCKRTYGTVDYGKICPYCGSEETWLQEGDECVIQEIEVS